MNVMCFSWNASGLKLCETASQDKADKARKGFMAFVSRKKPCLAPDFFEEIRNAIRSKSPGLVVMTTQDEDVTDTYFHAEFLPHSMGEIGYTLLKRDKLDGIGEAASRGYVDTVPTGTPSGSALRMSVYGRNNLLPELKVGEKKIANFFSQNDGQIEYSRPDTGRVSGAICSYVWHDAFGKFAFIAAHLPSGAEALKVGQGMPFDKYRAASVASNTLCLLEVGHKFVEDLPADSKPDHIFLMGDLNYDIVDPGKTNRQTIDGVTADLSLPKLKELRKKDELFQNKDKHPIDGFKEGPNDDGPMFLPTWRLQRKRDASCSGDKSVPSACFVTPNADLGGIGWHDRILYQEMGTSHYSINCLAYNRLDVENMRASTHAGVTALFEIKSR